MTDLDLDRAVTRSLLAVREEQLIADWNLLRTVGRIRVRVLAEKMGPEIMAFASESKALGRQLPPALSAMVRMVRREKRRTA